MVQQKSFDSLEVEQRIEALKERFIFQDGHSVRIELDGWELTIDFGNDLKTAEIWQTKPQGGLCLFPMGSNLMKIFPRRFIADED